MPEHLVMMACTHIEKHVKQQQLLLSNIHQGPSCFRRRSHKKLRGSTMYPQQPLPPPSLSSRSWPTLTEVDTEASGWHDIFRSQLLPHAM